ncbi:unnamed protein product [Closterium sp. NIES-64]|nr:unnamed protein product [Closterium sp. NIES-64]
MSAKKVGQAVQADWDNREFVESLRLNIHRIYTFVNDFAHIHPIKGECQGLAGNLVGDMERQLADMKKASAKGRLAALNSKLTSLERQLTYLESQPKGGGPELPPGMDPELAAEMQKKKAAAAKKKKKAQVSGGSGEWNVDKDGDVVLEVSKGWLNL